MYSFSSFFGFVKENECGGFEVRSKLATLFTVQQYLPIKKRKKTE